MGGDMHTAPDTLMLGQTRQDAQKLADSWGLPYIECLSKTGEHVADVFHTLLKEIEKDDGLLAETGEGGCKVL